MRFGQILANLGSNAVKFTDRGEVVVQAQVTHQDPARVVLRIDVSDTGVGIPPDARERLFDAFTQADPSTTRRHGGTGLGLAISRQLVQAMGGELSLDSEVGRGSTFSFTATFARAASGSQRRPDRPHLLHGRRVLVVDDNETNRFILEQQLAAWQMQPVTAATAEEALATLREAARAGRPFEIALLDLMMPGTDGLELARQIGADPTLRQLTMLLLSSDLGLGSQAARSAGIRAALNKPVRHSELYDALLGIVSAEGSEEQRPARGEAPDLGVRVLVVEDNYVNQLVATGLLENLGYVVEVANDGAQAVERLAGSHAFSAVLMDCRMPRLDGFDATRAIRSHEASGERVPIIAMTASALEGERERCLAVGMDDFLTKPVDARELEAAIARWTGGGAGSDPEPSPATAAATAPSAVLDRERIEMLDALKKDGVSFFERTAASFMSRSGGQVLAIRDAARAGDAMGLMTSAHQLKGSALNLGLPLVGATAARLEALGDAGRTDGAEALLEELVADVDRAVQALQKTIGEKR